MRARARRGRLRLRGRRQGHGLPHRRRRPAADQPGAAGGLRRRRGRRRRSSRCRGSPSRARRSRSSASPSSRERRPWNAFITRVEPGGRRAGPALRVGRSRVKDLFDTAGVRTTYGSGLYARPRARDGTRVAVQRLLDAGAVLVGKTHLPEFAWSVLGAERVVRHVSQPARIPGRRPAARRAARRRRSPPVSASSRSARTPAARSGCRRRPARSSG